MRQVEKAQALGEEAIRRADKSSGEVKALEKRLQDLEKKSREELEEAKERENGIRTRVKERDD